MSKGWNGNYFCLLNALPDILLLQERNNPKAATNSSSFPLPGAANEVSLVTANNWYYSSPSQANCSPRHPHSAMSPLRRTPSTDSLLKELFLVRILNIYIHLQVFINAIIAVALTTIMAFAYHLSIKAQTVVNEPSFSSHPQHPFDQNDQEYFYLLDTGTMQRVHKVLHLQILNLVITICLVFSSLGYLITKRLDFVDLYIALVPINVILQIFLFYCRIDFNCIQIIFYLFDFTFVASMLFSLNRVTERRIKSLQVPNI